MAQRTGIVAALTAALLFGASTPCAKLLLGEISPWMLAGILYLGSGLGLGLLCLVRPRGTARLNRQEGPWLIGAILAGGIAGPVLLMSGLAHTQASTASLLLNAEGVLTALLAWSLFRENAGRRVVLGMAAISVGALILSWPEGAVVASWPAGLILAACLCWAIDNNLTRKVSLADPVQIAAWKGLVAGASNLALALALGAPLPAWDVIAWGAGLGLFGYGLSLVAFVIGLRELGTARTGAYFSLAPFAGAALAVGVFGEPFTVPLGLAAGLMGWGLWLHLTERHDHDHSHEALDHRHAHSHDEHHQHHDGAEPAGRHVHQHHHAPLTHRHPHFPDSHHRHVQ